MSAGDLHLDGLFLTVEDAIGNKIPIAFITDPAAERLIQSLTVIHAVCKDTDMDTMREMQSAGLTFKKAWQRAVMNQVAEVIADITGMQVEAIPVTEEVLKEIIGGENETKH